MSEKFPKHPDHVGIECLKIYYRENAKLNIDNIAYRLLVADMSFWCICIGAIANAINTRTAFIS